jgi:transposase
VLAARKSVIVRSIARNASGNHPRSGPFVDALVEGLRHAAREARVLHRTHVDFVELQAEVTVEVDAMLADIKAVSDLDRRIEVLYAELQPNDVLRSIPGVGQHLAPVLIGVLHTADRFRSERHIRGFCGLFPRRADSGGAERPGQRITQGGNNRIKRALMLAAIPPARSIPNSPRSTGG